MGHFRPGREQRLVVSCRQCSRKRTFELVKPEPPLEADAINPLAKQFYAEALAVSFADAAIFMTKYCSANVYRAFISP